MHRADITKPSFLASHRYWIMALALVLFLPPLSFLFQFTGDTNFCGSWCPRMFFVWRKGATLSTYCVGFARSYMGALLVGGILGTTFFFGRYWCSHLCPIGGSMELGSRLVPRFLKINFAGIPAPAFRYGYLSVYFGAAAIGLGSLCCSYCQFAAIPRLIGAPFAGADLAYFLRTAGLINLGLVLVLGLLAKGGRAYCNLLCPVGALDALVNRAGLRRGRRVRIDHYRCSGCGDCLDKCPVWAIDLSDNHARIEQLSCTPCRACETACTKGAIGYGISSAAIAAPEGRLVDEKA